MDEREIETERESIQIRDYVRKEGEVKAKKGDKDKTQRVGEGYAKLAFERIQHMFLLPCLLNIHRLIEIELERSLQNSANSTVILQM